MSDLKRFHEAQQYDYEIALAEIKRGRKSSCWMWYIFPQLTGLGYSSMAQYYGISNLQEAKDYLNDEVLRKRLIDISEALLKVESDNATEVMGIPDDKKLKSSMTLFSAAAPDIKVFSDVLDKFFWGERDHYTLKLLGME